MQERGPEPALSAPPGASRWRFVAAVATAVVVLDQTTKWWALQALADRTIDLVWTLRLRLVFNPGAAFGIGSRFAPLLALLALGIVAYLLRRSDLLRTRTGTVGVALVLGGAVGNLLDRVFRDGGGFLGGAVVDFVDLQWWPVFNVADVAITLGAVAVALGSLRAEEGAADAAPSGRADPG